MRTEKRLRRRGLLPSGKSEKRRDRHVTKAAVEAEAAEVVERQAEPRPAEVEPPAPEVKPKKKRKWGLDRNA